MKVDFARLNICEHKIRIHFRALINCQFLKINRFPFGRLKEVLYDNLKVGNADFIANHRTPMVPSCLKVTKNQSNATARVDDIIRQFRHDAVCVLGNTLKSCFEDRFTVKTGKDNCGCHNSLVFSGCQLIDGNARFNERTIANANIGDFALPHYGDIKHGCGNACVVNGCQCFGVADVLKKVIHNLSFLRGLTHAKSPEAPYKPICGLQSAVGQPTPTHGRALRWTVKEQRRTIATCARKKGARNKGTATPIGARNLRRVAVRTDGGRDALTRLGYAHCTICQPEHQSNKL